MRLGTLVVVLAIAAGCKKHPAPAAAVGSGAGSGSAAADGSAAAAASPVLAFDPVDPRDDDPDAVRVAFHGKKLRLAAVSADGTLLADYDWLGDGPTPPPYPMQVVLREVGTSTIRETLPLLDEAEAASALQAGSAWQTPALTKTLEARGDAIVARLEGFHSLEKIDTAETAQGKELDVKLGAVTLSPGALELRDASGRVLHASQLDPYSTGSGDSMCGYDPMLREAYHDAGTLYIEVSYRYRDDCDAPPLYVYAWSLDPAKADPAAVIRGLVTHQFEAVPAIAVVGTTQPAAFADKAKSFGTPADVQIAMARDGSSAWASATAGDSWRASDVVIKTPNGWQLAAIAWTEAKDNAAVNADAKAGKLHAATLAGGPADPGLTDAFKKLTTDGVDAAAAKNTDLVALGSGPGERTVGGAGFARAWNAVWKGKVTIASSVATVAPSGTTGWVTASVELQKPGYKMPFLVFAVFDKGADGAWTLVHIHFAV